MTRESTLQRQIILPFPPACLSGHNTGHWHLKAKIIADHRLEAFALTKQARIKVPKDGDILIHFRFVPPDNRGDRTNFASRLKPQIDGISDALGVNDKRFLPSYEFCEPQAPGRIEVEIRA